LSRAAVVSKLALVRAGANRIVTQAWRVRARLTR
jgi:hypothetical protein